MWAAIARANRERLLAEVDRFADLWKRLRAAIASGDERALAEIMEEGARLRRRLDGR
jgi:prephenate dehydrogenase